MTSPTPLVDVNHSSATTIWPWQRQEMQLLSLALV